MNVRLIAKEQKRNTRREILKVLAALKSYLNSVISVFFLCAA